MRRSGLSRVAVVTFAGTMAFATSCERKLDSLACPCVSGYVCCALDNTCRPESEGCGDASGGSTGQSEKGDGASGADGGSAASGVATGGGAGGESGAASAGAPDASGGVGNDTAGGAAGSDTPSLAGTSNEPSSPATAFPRYCSFSGWCGGRNTFAAAWSSGEDVWVAANDRKDYTTNSLSRWDGAGFRNYDDLRESWGRVLAIGGSGPDDVWFVGDETGHALAQHWDGVRFSEVMHPEAGELRGVWASAPDDVWAVGVQGYAIRFDGVEWSSELAPSFTHDLNAVWGSARDDVIAVGYGGVVARWDGAEWTIERDGSGADLAGVWGSGPDDVWAVGAGATVLHFDGESWSARDLGLPELVGAEFVAVAGTSASDVWIAERGGRLVHFDGDEFRVLTTSAKGLAALAASGEGDVWALGELAFAARCAPAECVEAQPVTSEDLLAVWGRSVEDVWAVGTNGTIVHFDGAAWSLVESPTTAELRAIHGAPDGSVWAAGDAIVRYEDGEWSSVSDVETATIQAVFAFANDDVWMAGDAASLRHFDGKAWATFDTLGATETLTGLWGSAPNDVWAVGVGNTNLHFDGMTWSTVPAPDAIHFAWQLVSGTARDNVFIHGWYRDLAPSFGEGRFDGSEWSFEGGDYGAALATYGRPAAWAVGPREVLMVSGAEGGFTEIYRLGSNLWGDAAGTDLALYGVWGTSPDDSWVVGADGTILEKEFTLPEP